MLKRRRLQFKYWSFALVIVMIVNLMGSLVPFDAEAAVYVAESAQINNMDSAANATGDTLGGTIAANSDPQYIKEGTGSKKWTLFKTDGTLGLADVFPKSGPQKNWTDYNQLSFWAYSTKVRPEPNKPIRIRFYPTTNTSNYYYFHILLDWTGWKKIEIPLSTVMKQKVGTPAAWGNIEFMRFDPAPIGGVAADQGSVLYMDDFRLDKTIEVQPVQASTPSGQYDGPVTVSLTTPTPNASIWYQREGIDNEYKLFSEPLLISQSVRLLAKSRLNGFESEVTTFDYTILSQGQVGAVEADPPAGTYPGPVQVALSSPTVGASVYYQVYGAGGPFLLYQSPLPISTSQKLVTKAKLNGMESVVKEHAYVIKPQPALANKPNGEYTGSIEVTLSTATPGAIIMYKLGGQSEYILYTSPIKITASQTLWTKSVLGDTPSDETTYNYTIVSGAYREISNTETFGGWTNIAKASTPVKEGVYSGKWSSPVSPINVNDITASWAQYDQLEVWAYSGSAANNKIYFIIDCDVPGGSYDYYIMPVTVDWTGWKKVMLPLSQFTKSTANTNFANYRKLIIHPRWYASDPQPNPGTVMYFDKLALAKNMIELSTPGIEKYALPGSTMNYTFTLQNKSGADAKYTVSQDPDRSFGSGYIVTTPGVTETVPALGELQINVQVQVPSSATVGDAKQAAVLIKSLQDGAEEEVLLKLTVAEPQASLQQHPYVLLTQDQLAKAKDKAGKYSWAKDYVNAIVQKADEWVNEAMYVPDRPGGHSIWYYCGDTPLIYDYTKPHEHVCPTDGKVYSGGDYDFAWRGTTHRRDIDAVRYMALAYMFTDDIRYAQKAKDVLVQYANYYPGYPVQTRNGRLFWQTLDEAVQIIKLAQAYDVLYNSGLFSRTEKFDIENNLFRQSAQTLKGYDMTKSNWQTWHNAAIGVIGALLHDNELIDFSVNGKSGFHYQMANSVLSDGFWWEGAINYHFYSQSALFIHAETLKHAGTGIDLFADPTLKKTFDVTLEYAFPDLGIINNNDSNNYPTNLAGGPDDAMALDYEGVYAAYKDPRYGALLNKIYNEHHVPRGGFNDPGNPYIINGEQAVLYGEEAIDASGELPSESRNFEGIGHAVLRTGKEHEQKYALVDYGLHGASHGNFDKLHLEIFGYDERLAPDPGVTSTYGVSLYQGYYKKTLSHNTVVVDQKDQAIQTAGSQETFDRTRLFLDSPHFRITSNSASKVYPGLSRYERTVAMTPDYMLDIFTLASSASHTYDWVLHGMGQFTAGQEMIPITGSIGNANGYQYFRNGTQKEMSGVGDNRWTTSAGNGLRWINVTDTPSTLLVGELPGPASSPDYTTTVLDRVYGSDAQFVSILEPYQGTSKIGGVQRLGADRIGVTLTDGRRHVLYYTENPVEGQASYYFIDGREYDMNAAVLNTVMNGNTLQVDYKPPVRADRVTAVVYAPAAQQVIWNGSVIPYSANNGYIVFEFNTPDVTPPADVTALQAIGGKREATLRWKDPADADADLAGVNIYIGSDRVMQVNKGAESATITGLKNGKNYTFIVKTVDLSGNESKGVEVNVKVRSSNKND